MSSSWSWKCGLSHHPGADPAKGIRVQDSAKKTCTVVGALAVRLCLVVLRRSQVSEKPCMFRGPWTEETRCQNTRRRSSNADRAEGEGDMRGGRRT